MDEKDREIQELRRQVESLKIELRKRTPEERAAYAEGFAAGYKKGLEPQTVILRTTCLIRANELSRILEGLKLQRDNGLIILGPELEFCGVMPRDAEIEVIRKVADDD